MGVMADFLSQQEPLASIFNKEIWRQNYDSEYHLTDFNSKNIATSVFCDGRKVFLRYATPKDTRKVQTQPIFLSLDICGMLELEKVRIGI